VANLDRCRRCFLAPLLRGRPQKPGTKALGVRRNVTKSRVMRPFLGNWSRLARCTNQGSQRSSGQRENRHRNCSAPQSPGYASAALLKLLVFSLRSSIIAPHNCIRALGREQRNVGFSVTCAEKEQVYLLATITEVPSGMFKPAEHLVVYS
jgi:hypothetical protein